MTEKAAEFCCSCQKEVMSEVDFLNACKLDWEVSLFDVYVESIAFRIKILFKVILF